MKAKKDKAKKRAGFYQRKGFHFLVNLGAAVFAWFIPSEKLLPVAAIVLAVVFIGEIIRLKTRAKKYVHEVVGQMLKNEERKTFTSVFWMAIATVIISIFASSESISFAFVVLAIADPAAAIVGSRVPSKRFYKKKSLTGSTAFFLLAMLTTLAFLFLTSNPHQILEKALIISVVLTLVEIFSPPLDDNFTLLITASILFMYLV